MSALISKMCECGSELHEKNGVTMCPFEDRAQFKVSIQGEWIEDTKKNAYNFAHDAIHARRLKAWCGA